MEISSLLEDNNPSQRNAAVKTVNKWEKTGLLEGLKTETEKAGMAQLLENQARGKKRILNMVDDYKVDNVSEKVLRIILSYTGYINRKVWNK